MPLSVGLRRSWCRVAYRRWCRRCKCGLRRIPRRRRRSPLPSAGRGMRSTGTASARRLTRRRTGRPRPHPPRSRPAHGGVHWDQRRTWPSLRPGDRPGVGHRQRVPYQPEALPAGCGDQWEPALRAGQQHPGIGAVVAQWQRHRRDGPRRRPRCPARADSQSGGGGAGAAAAGVTPPCSSYYGQHLAAGWPKLFGTGSFPSRICGVLCR